VGDPLEPSAQGAARALDVDRVLEEVAAEVGLDDYGHPSFRDGLDVLVANIGAAHLTPLGEAVLAGSVRSSLRNRLRVVDWLRSHPVAAAAEPDVAVVILGLSRSGTTALSHLLGADPANRSLRGWEAQDSVPPPTTAGYWTDPRLLRARESASAVDQLNPRFKAIHHDAPEDPVECAVPLAQHFASISLTTLFNVEAYDDWLLGADLTQAYQWHRSVLQVLQADCPGPWQLKSPIHGFAMETIAATYPGAVFVQTHRDPVKGIASACSLVASLSGTFTDHDHRATIARHWPELLATILDRIVAFRARHGDDRFVDVAYADLVADPVGTVRRIYDRIGRPWTDDVEAALARHAAAAVPNRYGRHEYTLEEFGLDRDVLEARVRGYLDRFDIPREPV
jgi:hypothetical protein